MSGDGVGSQMGLVGAEAGEMDGGQCSVILPNLQHNACLCAHGSHVHMEDDSNQS